MVDGEGARVAIEEMSDGYRSILSVSLELLRLMSHIYGGSFASSMRDDRTVRLSRRRLDRRSRRPSAPPWQAQIGEWFVERFPETQFFATTYSPIICRAATSVLETPTARFRDGFRRVTGSNFRRLVNGNVLDVYSTDLFGQGTSLSVDRVAPEARTGRTEPEATA